MKKLLSVHATHMQLTCLTATLNVLDAGNREALRRCVLSVARLDVAHEHLVYDGASTDGTPAFLRELERDTPGLKVVSEPDSGLYAALNKGVRAAQGEWLLVLGADDEIVDGRALVEALSYGECQKADIVSSPVKGFPNAGDVYAGNPREALGQMPYPHQGLLMKVGLVRRLGGFDEQFRIAGDFKLMLLALMGAERIVYRGRPFVCFGNRGMSSQGWGGASENILLARQLHGLSPAESEALARIRQLPWRTIWRYLRHPSPQLRRSARYYLVRKVLKACRLLTPGGVCRWRRLET